MFPDLKSLTSSCHLPGISTIFETGPDDASLKQQHEDQCTEIDEELFNMLLQPVMGTPILTVEQFDNFVIPGQHLDPSAKTNPTVAHPKRGLKPIVKKEPGIEQIVDYTCRICQKPFDTQQPLKFHVDLHTGVHKMCPYPMCMHTFTTQYGLTLHLKGNTHKKNVQSNPSPKPIEPQNPPKQPSPKQSPSPKLGQNSKPAQAETPIESSKKNKDVKPTKPIASEKATSQPRLRAVQCANVNFSEETDSDREFNAKPLPNLDNEPQQFFVDLVREVNLETGKKFLCHKCRNSFTRRGDVKQHWKGSCLENPYMEILCKLCTDTKVVLRGQSNLIINVMQRHAQRGDFICLKYHTLFCDESSLAKHTDVCTRNVK